MVKQTTRLQLGIDCSNCLSTTHPSTTPNKTEQQRHLYWRPLKYTTASACMSQPAVRNTSCPSTYYKMYSVFRRRLCVCVWSSWSPASTICRASSMSVSRVRRSTFGSRAFSVAGQTVGNSLLDDLCDPTAYSFWTFSAELENTIGHRTLRNLIALGYGCLLKLAVNIDIYLLTYLLTYGQWFFYSSPVYG